MGKTLLTQHQTGLFTVGGGDFSNIGQSHVAGGTYLGSEASMQLKIDYDGVISGHQCEVSGGVSVTADIWNSIRKNSADAHLIYIPAGSPLGWYGPDGTSFAVAAGDGIALKFYTAGAHKSYLFSNANFEAASDHVQFHSLATTSGWRVTGGAGTFYDMLNGGLLPLTTYTSMQGIGVEIQKATTLENAYLYIISNGLAGADTFTRELIVNGVAGAPSVTVGAGTTGRVALTGSRALVAGDVVYWRTTQTGAGVVTCTVSQCAIRNAVDEEADIFICNMDAISFAAGGSVVHVPIQAGLQSDNSGIVVDSPLGFDASIGKVRLEVFNNTCTLDQHLKLYSSGVLVPGGIDVVIPAGTNGIFRDLVNSGSVGGAEFLTLGVSGGGAGAFSSKWFAHTINSGAAPPPAGAGRHMLAKLGPVQSVVP